MNARDSEVIAGLLRSMNYELSTDPKAADVIILNTCAVRQHAEDRVWSQIGAYKNESQSHKVTKSPIIGLVGCMAQNYKDKVFEIAPNVDFVVGPTDIHKIPGIIEILVHGSQFMVNGKSMFEKKIWETDSLVRPDEIYHTGFYADKNHAFVVISEGCENYCSYCVVPYVRGNLRSRKPEDIIKEIEQAIDKGITSITLLGQNVNAYKFIVHGSEFIDFVKLLEMVNRVKGLKEFSFLTSHPRDTTNELFKAVAGFDKLKKSLHLPVQSGSDKILNLMNRGYTRKFYLDLVSNYRKIVKNGVLTTDVIVGFPSESEEDFMDTYNLVKEVEFNSAYIFKYSPRPHTEALKFADNIDAQEKNMRHKKVLDLQRKISKSTKG